MQSGGQGSCEYWTVEKWQKEIDSTYLQTVALKKSAPFVTAADSTLSLAQSDPRVTNVETELAFDIAKAHFKLVAETDGTLDASATKIYDSLPQRRGQFGSRQKAAVSVLSVDSIIMSKPTGGPKITAAVRQLG
ncbi:hypothetical protein B0H14DRAFT_3459672 [Mycena olivaceomarginata]|nr:hypothetical protein B0H14DRAFT_3459672 [Mycena olivaceomarginata]